MSRVKHAAPPELVPALAAGDHLIAIAIDGIDDEGRGRGLYTVNGETWDIAVRGAFPGDEVDVEIERVFASRTLAQGRARWFEDASGDENPAVDSDSDVDVVIENDPNERVSDTSTDVEGPAAAATSTAVIIPGQGPLHIPRTCGHDGPCAACPLHGVDPGFVLELKRSRVLAAIADADLADAIPENRVGTVVVGGGTRQKVKLMAFGTAGALRLGHYVPHSHVTVDADRCGHTDDAIVDAVEDLIAGLDRMALGPERLVAVIARHFQEGVMAILVGKGPAPSTLSALLTPRLVGIGWRTQDEAASANAIVGGTIHDVVGLTVGTPLDGGAPTVVDAFCQADLLGAAELVERACHFVVGYNPALLTEPVLDLYAGTGAFARGLVAVGARKVIAVESFPASVVALRRLPFVEGIEGAVEDVIVECLKRSPIAAVVDPPRKGLGPVAPILARASSLRRVALVSCDLKAFARDVAAFVAAGWKVRGVVPVDLFPGSVDVEVLTYLTQA